MNFAKGILESRKQHYKALKDVLRPLPLSTPTSIEVGLHRYIRVTLLDANHCTGAVMFLIEDPRDAILYTGDIRAEVWWVNSLVRNPIILPYTIGIKRLNKIYLDTTFAIDDERYRRFQSKAAGIKELLDKVARYPPHTVFHFHAWTFGYEDVWIALSSALHTQIHVDDYKRRLYGSLVPEYPSQYQQHEGPALVGFTIGNHFQRGCLTKDNSVRLHSCEHGTGCPSSSSSGTVYITPVTNSGGNGEVLSEKGAGGGGGDLLQTHGYVELSDQTLTSMLIDLCEERIEDPTTRSRLRDIITQALGNEDQVISLDAICPSYSEDDIKLDDFVANLIRYADSNDRGKSQEIQGLSTQEGNWDRSLPSRIQFPYARHSSYEELCELVTAFRPNDIFPCTTDWQEWSWDKGVECLFGHLCSGKVFAHDRAMAGLESARKSAHNRRRSLSSTEYEEPNSFPILVSGAPKIQDEATPEPPASARQDHPYYTDEVGVRLPKRKIAEIRRCFERPLKAVKALERLDHRSLDLPAPGSQAENGHCQEVASQAPFNDGDLQELARYRSFSMRQQLPGTQSEPIELSDDGSLMLNSQDPGGVVLDASLQPEIRTEADLNNQVEVESQLSLSDTAFESQRTNLGPLERDAQVQSRKHAYRAARDLDGAWAEDLSLVSLCADQQGKDLEL